MPTNFKKVAIVHDWLLGYRGGERVLEAILELYPEADIFTLFHEPGTCGKEIESRIIYTSVLNRLPQVHKYYRYLLPWMPWAIERLNLQPYDLVISSSHCVAKGIIPNPNALHVSYSHTTMRYAWDQYSSYFEANPLEWLISWNMHRLRQWDVTSSARVDQFIANSQFVANRIQSYYRRKSEVIHPFVDLSRFHLEPSIEKDGYLVVSALVPYKKVELAMLACRKLQKKLTLVGAGPEWAYLKRYEGQGITFLGNLPAEKLGEEYRKAKALLFPGAEDFGITPLESMACGTPVIAYREGGALETVVENKTGFFFKEQTLESLAQAILSFENQPVLDPKDCRKQAELFTRERFKSKMLACIETAHEAKFSNKKILPSYEPPKEIPQSSWS